MALLHPESDLTLSTLTQGGQVINHLKRQGRPVIVDDLLAAYLRQDHRRTPITFFQVIDLLYVVGAVELDGYRLALVSATRVGREAGAEDV
jgi:hypothetical protein